MRAHRYLTIVLLGAAAASAGEHHGHDHSGPQLGGRLMRVGELPPGPLRQRLQALPAPARERALLWLATFTFPASDAQHLRVDARGGVHIVCNALRTPAGGARDEGAARLMPGPASAAVPVSSPPIRHSRPGAAKVIYLDFNGHTVSGTAWNSSLGRDVPAVPYSTDGDLTTFSDAEQIAIERVWRRVAEDYAPFDVDVTTEEPAAFGPSVARVLITRSTDANGLACPYSSAGGVAYVNVFGQSNFAYYQPAWVYANNLGGGREDYIAEAASHEAGHNLGLSHDGTASQGYYNGHGSGDVSWAPLMGTGYNRNVSQWSKGEYTGASQTQDDLAIIAGKLAYRADDHANVAASATVVPPASDGAINAAGIISTTADVDVFRIETGAGSATINVDPVLIGANTRGGNLDIRAELRDAAGNLIVASDPADRTYARIAATLPGGTCYLHIHGVGTGSPTGTGYSDYGSLGQYWITGSVPVGGPPPLPTLTIAAGDAAAAEVPSGGTANPGSFVISRSGGTTTALTVRVAASGSASPGADYAAIPATVTIPVGSASATVAVTVSDDTAVEGSETVVLGLVADAAYAIGSPSSASVAIADDDAPPPPGAGTGLSATYFDNMDFSGPTVTRVDATVDFSWGSGAPAAGIGADTFSVRWRGQVQAPLGGTWTFSTVSDDGVRLWVNGVKIIENWTNHSPTENSGSIALAAGTRFDVVMEFYENGGGATARLLWSGPSTAKQVVPQAQLFPDTVLPAPWRTLDIGAVAAAGGAAASNGVFTVVGSGADIWSTTDEFRFVHQPLTGDGVITARVTGLTNTNSWAKAGVMVRDGLAANAPHVLLCATPGNGTAFHHRGTAGGTTSNLGAGAGAPVWLRLTRSGGSVTAARSADGTNWTDVATRTLGFAAGAQVGLAVTSHSDGTLCTATFTDVTVVPIGGG